MHLRTAAALAALTAAALSPAAARADEPAPTADPYGYQDGIGDYFVHWFDRVDAAQASQPHWITPLYTVTPRLEEEFRYDQYWEHLGNGASVDQFDSGKGLELIPTLTNEVLINLPPYVERANVKPVNGWNDWPFLTIKQRLASANEQNGNYIVTAFLGFQAPNGNTRLTNHAWLITPTLAGGKGWGDFDFQSTLGVALPMADSHLVGTAINWNLTVQYHFLNYFWPEFETNYTHWVGGERGGKTQLFLLPGIVLGRFQLYDRARLIVGAGYQFAVTPKLVTEPALTPIYNHAWIVSGRVAF